MAIKVHNNALQINHLASELQIDHMRDNSV